MKQGPHGFIRGRMSVELQQENMETRVLKAKRHPY